MPEADPEPADFYVITRAQLIDALMHVEVGDEAVSFCDTDDVLVFADDLADAILARLAGRRISAIQQPGEDVTSVWHARLWGS